MINRITHSRLLFVVLIGALVLLTPGMFRGALAQGNTPPTLVRTPDPKNAKSTTVSNTPGQADIVLADIGVTDYEMVSPSSIAQFRFRIPDNWEPKGLNSLQLAIDYTQTGLDLLQEKGASAIATVLKVYLDDKLINTTYLPAQQQGPQTLSVQLPTDVIGNAERRVHTLRINLEAQEVCLVNAQVRVVIHADQSVLHLEYNELPPLLDLANFPRPFYNSSFNRGDNVTLVLPSKKTADDLESASIVAAGLGYLSGDALNIKTVDADALTPEDKKGNLILIGPLGRNPITAQLYTDSKFPTKRGLDGTITTTSNNAVAADDGILQMIANPDNPMRAILAVTGQTPTAVKKAAQALSNSPETTLFQGPLGLISSFQNVSASTVPQVTQFTFRDLGYTDNDLTVQGRGTRFIDVDFNVPLNMRITQDAFVNLSFKYSNTVVGARTSVSLLMNGTPFASNFMENASQEQAGAVNPTQSVAPSTLRAAIPVNLVRGGLRNRLTMVIETQGNWFCFAPSQYAIFFSASADSQLNLPLTPANPTDLNSQVAWFPAAFSRNQTLDDVLFSLPTEPTAEEINQAMHYASRLGAGTNSQRGFSPHVIMGELPTGTDLSKYHIIVFGRPTTNPFLQSLNEKLPQGFVEKSDDLQQVTDNAVYRLSQDYPVGVLETLLSPWSPAHLILVISGNRTDAQLQAGDTLLNPETDPARLAGDVVFVREKLLSPIDSRRVKEAAGLLTAVPSFSTQVAQNETSTAQSPSPTANDTQPTVTITPIYTLTPSPTVATPFPTYPPLPDDQANPTQTPRPLFIDALFTVTLLALFVTALYGLIRAMRRTRRS